MSTPRSPNPTGSLVLVAGGVIAILVVSWLVANLIIGIWRVADFLEELLWL